jgi:hypothetical protein
MSWTNPITNRTAGAKYNASDLNRVGDNIQYLADAFNSYGYTVAVSPKTDWANADIPNETQMTAYLADIQALIDAYYTLTTTPSLPSDIEGLTYSEANDIEQILLDMKTLLDNMIAEFRYCGEIFSGEV